MPPRCATSCIFQITDVSFRESERTVNSSGDQYESALRRAVKLLSSKARTVTELHELLIERYGFDAAVTARAIERLKQLGYLNDDQLAANLASSRLRVRPIGRRRMRHELRQRKLTEPVVQTAVRHAYETRDEKELVEEAIQKRIRLKGRPKTRQELKNLYDHLLRLGFEYETIRQGLTRIPKLELDESA